MLNQTNSMFIQTNSNGLTTNSLKYVDRSFMSDLTQHFSVTNIDALVLLDLLKTAPVD